MLSHVSAFTFTTPNIARESNKNNSYSKFNPGEMIHMHTHTTLHLSPFIRWL